MAASLRKRKAPGSCERGGGEADPCPVCLEALTEDQFRFPCGHGVCSECERRLATRNFLSCPTCRTPREGVSQHEVEHANRDRVQQDMGDNQLVIYAGGRHFEVLFFPDESEGAHPFGPLLPQTRARSALRHGAALVRPVEQANPTEQDALAVQAAGDVLAGDARNLQALRLSGERITLYGPMRELVNALTRPTSIQEFLAQRERLRVGVPAAAATAAATPTPTPTRARRRASLTR